MRVFKKKGDVRTDKNTAEKIEEVNRQLDAYFNKQHAALDHLEVLSYLGEGTYALVNLAHDRVLHKKVALKIFDKKTLIVNRRLFNLIAS